MYMSLSIALQNETGIHFYGKFLMVNFLTEVVLIWSVLHFKGSPLGLGILKCGRGVFRIQRGCMRF